ncbi:MAG: hypothetical protein QOE51_2254 [Actinoplanes sp.]|nr:hypothetical protein [Actinoplanes sp.]
MTARLIGGEMLGWSDLDGTHGPGPVCGGALAAVLAPLLERAPGRTLVAGPHDPGLIAEHSTVLLRGLADAQALAGRFDVLCGGPGGLSAEGLWDTVVALDGLDRLASAEEPQLSWAATFEQLVEAVRPGGTFLLAHENLLGLHRLTALAPELTDSDWAPAAGYDNSRPTGLAAVTERLQTAGLTVTHRYATFPNPIAATAVLDHALLSDKTRQAFVEVTLSRAFAEATPSSIPAGATPSDSVAQPTPTGTAAGPTSSGTSAAATLSSAFAEGVGLLSDPGRLAVSAVRHGLAADLAPGWIVAARRTGVAAPARPPTGCDRTLESLLLEAAAERDLPALRRLLAAWQSGPAAAVAAGQVIVGTDGDHAPFAAPITPEAALHAFAVRVLADGFSHPWPAPASAAELTRTLAAMAGTDLDSAAIPAGRHRPSVRDLLADHDRLTRELAQARIRHEFLERTIADRDRALRHARLANGPLLAARALRRTARRLLHG